MDELMFAAKIHDDTHRVKVYAEQLLKIVRSEFSKRNINLYDYEKFVNVLTCLNLQADAIKEDLNDYINKKSLNNYKRIDYRI